MYTVVEIDRGNNNEVMNQDTFVEKGDAIAVAKETCEGPYCIVDRDRGMIDFSGRGFTNRDYGRVLALFSWGSCNDDDFIDSQFDDGDDEYYEPNGTHEDKLKLDNAYESCKVTLTLGQLKRLVKESLVLEYEEVLVVTPSGEELGVLDDEGNFRKGGYPRSSHDAGEYVDSDGYYAKKCGKYNKFYGYDVKEPAKPEIEEFPMEKLFFGKDVKSESQAIYFLYQIVCLAQGKKKSPISKAMVSDIVGSLRKIQDQLGIVEPEVTKDDIKETDIIGDYRDSLKKNYPTDNLKWLDARMEEVRSKALREWENGSMYINQYGKPCTLDFQRACSNALGSMYGIDLKAIKNLLLEYYRTDKAARSTDKIVSFIQDAVNKQKINTIVHMAEKMYEVYEN